MTRRLFQVAKMEWKNNFKTEISAEHMEDVSPNVLNFLLKILRILTPDVQTQGQLSSEEETMKYRECQTAKHKL